MVNFKTEITTDRVNVSKTERSWPPNMGAIITAPFLIGMAVYAIAKCLVPLDVWFYPSNWPLLLAVAFFAGSLLWRGIRILLPSGESLSCDHSTLVVGRIPDSSLRGRWNYEEFPIRVVKGLQFGAIGYQVTGLRFEVDGKTKKILAGLESPEAQKILDALATLGVDIIRDPAMPMMIDMTLSRRKRGGIF